MSAPRVKVNRHGSVSISSGGFTDTFGEPYGSGRASLTAARGSANDAHMTSAVDSLINVLEAGDTGSGQGENYEEISSLIAKMVEEEGAYDNSPHPSRRVPPPPPRSGERGAPSSAMRSQRRGRGGAPPLALRAGPTPYELWETRNPTAETKRAVKLTNAERDEVTARLARSGADSNFRKMKAQTSAMADELEGLTFTPKLYNKTITLTRGLEPLQSRYEVEIEHRKLRLKQQQLEVISNELRDTTFEPDMSHTRAVNERLLAETGMDQMNVVDRCMEYGEEAKARLRVRGEIMKRLEARVHTFSPHITAKSREICARTGYRSTPDNLATYRHRGRGLKGKALLKSKRRSGKDKLDNTHLVGHEEETFHPKITNDHNKALARDATPIHERLYARAAKINAAQLQNTSAALQRSYRFAEGRGKGARGTPGAGVLNIISWEAPRHNFIAQRFAIGQSAVR